MIDKPTDGLLIIGNDKIDSSDDTNNDKIRSKKIGIIYQQNNLLSDFTALENVYLAGLALNNDKKNSIKKSKKIIKKMGLSSRQHHYPSELSGGEMQRIAMARALINEPEIILADEPTGSLDQKTAKEVFRVLYNLKNKNRLIIYATHNRFFANMADCKLEMIDGNIKTINARIK
jgi:ABC-type lipoprotein export system ATPase subunit